MNQQPKPESKKYSDLISEIEKGEIKIPKFQREFVWSLEQTAKLLDSIIKGYPIGTFIMRETTERFNDLKNIGNFKLPEPKDGVKIQYVLDGQQRMTSLFAAFRGEKIIKEGEKKETNYADIYVDLTVNIEACEDQIVITEKPEHSKYISLHKILHSENYFDEIEEFDRDERKKINDYAKVFAGYDFSTIILRKDDINSAIEVFTRINTGGKTLTLFEIMSAKTYDLEVGFDMQDERNLFIDELEKVGYDTIWDTIVLHITSLVLSKTKECKREVILNLDKDEIIKIWPIVLESLRESIDYFRMMYRIPVSGLLPYDSLLVPFSYFHYHKPQGPNNKQAEYLEEFFWRASLSHRYRSSTESRIAQDIKRIDQILNDIRPEYDDGFTIDFSSPSDLINKDFRAGNSFCKAIMCLLAYYEPKDFNTNKKVNLDNAYLKKANSKNYHHFFPKAYLKNNNIANENSLVNITLVSDSLNKRTIGSKSPSHYIGDFIEKSELIVNNSLKSHLIGNCKEFGILSDDYNVFLQKRAEIIYEELIKRIECKNTVEDTNISIKKLILEGENNKVEFKETLRYDVRQSITNGQTTTNVKMEFSVGKTLCAFMNTDGGTLFIGVDDDSNIEGLLKDYHTLPQGKQNKDGFELHLKGVIKKYLGDNLDKYIKVSFPIIEEIEICMIEVFKNSKPIFIKSEGTEVYYIRNGNGSEPKSGSGLVGYL